MAAFVAGEGVPVLVEEMVEDAGFYFAGGLGGTHRAGERAHAGLRFAFYGRVSTRTGRIR